MAEHHRVRTFNFELKLFEEENAMLTQNAHELGVSKSEYLRTLLMAGSLAGVQWTMDRDQGQALIDAINDVANAVRLAAYCTKLSDFEANPAWTELKKRYLELLGVLGMVPFVLEEERAEWARLADAIIRREAREVCPEELYTEQEI